MTRQETAQIMDILKAAYPQFYSKLKANEMANALTLWAALFADDDPKIVGLAVKALIVGDTKGFPPVIGQVKEYMRRITRPSEMTEAEAWALLAKAVRNSGYNSVKEFDNLPVLIQRLVGSPTQLKEWAMVDTDELQTVVQSNFMRSYRARSQSEREYLALPQEVRELMSGLASGMSMLSDRTTAIEPGEAE